MLDAKKAFEVIDILLSAIYHGLTYRRIKQERYQKPSAIFEPLSNFLLLHPMPAPERRRIRDQL